MDMWSNICRCCMSANCKVSLLDTELNLKQKFLEVTDIEVKVGEGLPHKLCNDCYNTMITAHQFRKKCIQTDNELKLQLNAIFEEETTKDEFDDSTDSKKTIFETEEVENDPMKQLEAVIKKNALDSDDDCYYVLVIGNPKEKKGVKNDEMNSSAAQIKFENPNDDSDQDDHEYLSDFSYQSDLSYYTEIEEPQEQEHLCKLCGKTFEAAEILMGHTLLHSSTGLLINCPFCQQPIKRNALTTHIKTGHVNVKPCCNICFKTFSTTSHLKRHMAVHKTERSLKEFECDLCFKSFHEKITMQMHRLIHTHPYYCSQCDHTFLNRTLLNEHKSIGCNKSERKRDEFTTKQANIRGRPKKFPDAIPQKRNPRPKETPQCYECGEVLTNKRELQIHIQTSHENYSGDKMKRFECSICRKRFTSGAKLTMHERVHTNERPYPCQLCSNRFKTKTHLRTHQLTHSRDKKFSCPLCPRKFNLKYNLRNHLRSHAGDQSSVTSTPKRKK